MRGWLCPSVGILMSIQTHQTFFTSAAWEVRFKARVWARQRTVFCHGSVLLDLWAPFSQDRTFCRTDVVSASRLPPTPISQHLQRDYMYTQRGWDGPTQSGTASLGFNGLSLDSRAQARLPLPQTS
ncbi:hypothetical protein BC827DRAFT_180986 [Russula dissimulans]|nr:hypothetical protein BC827DRAFT_180986 [Russula dissimulans]